ncbi:MAG: hypothetical protein KBB91_03105 [Candidatus Pacebacteria bacterium]|nr:hypothetical protein [Candidatus Paceibacterota bacterium]MBP9701306.1 hypothetical protein [Candidatus Paceibacterota bacterium]
MDPKLDERLTRIEKKLDDMNAVVSRMHRSQRNARNRKFLYWAVIITLSIISYYSIQPYIEDLKDTYQTTQETTSTYAELLKTFSQ